MSSGLFHDNRIVQYPSGSFTSSTGVVKKSTRKRKKKNRKVNSNRFPLSTSDYLIDPHSKSTFSFTSTRARSRRFSTSLDFRSQCVSRLVDSCTWPQCNSLCPPLLNPLTGEEMHLSDLLRSFGFNMASFASSFGIDPQTFNSMDRRLLLQLLSNNWKDLFSSCCFVNHHLPNSICSIKTIVTFLSTIDINYFNFTKSD